MPLLAMLTAVALLLPLPARAPKTLTAAPRTEPSIVVVAPTSANGEELEARVEIGPAVLTIFDAKGKVVSRE